MLYERNEIKKVDGKDVIFISFPYNDGTYDYIDLDNIKKVEISDRNIDYYESVSNTVQSKTITFECNYDKTSPTKVFINAKIDNVTGSKSEIELQDFADIVARQSYINEMIDKQTAIASIKDKSEVLLSKSYALETNNLINDKRYKISGKILDKEGRIVGTVNEFYFLINTDKTMEFTLEDCVMYETLYDDCEMKIYLYNGENLIIIDNFTIKSKKESIIKTFKIEVKRLKYEKVKDRIITPVFVNDIELFYEERLTYLTDREEIFKSNNAKRIANDFDDLFDL